MSVTIKDVADRCGLSVSTVSKAFNHYSDISSKTRDLVQRTAREIGYYPNAIARTLKTNRSFNLGVLFVDDNQSGLTHSFFATVLDAFKREGERHGYDVTFINHNIGRTNMTYLEHCRYRNVDGVCLACVDFYAPEVVELAAGDIPCVTIDHVFSNRTCIMSGNVDGMQALTEHVISQGHTRIAYVHGQHSSVTESRITGFYRALSKHGIQLPEAYMMNSPYDNAPAGYEAMTRLMQLPEPPTCVFMPDDTSAIGALDAAADLGLRVPQDVSIAGFDGIRLGQMIRPRLTTVQQDTRSMGTQAAIHLIDRIENPRTAGSTIITIPCRLIPGESARAL